MNRWYTPSGGVISQLAFRPGYAELVAFSYLADIRAEPRGFLEAWNYAGEGGRPLLTETVWSSNFSFVFSPNGEHILALGTSTRREALLFDLRNGQCLPPMPVGVQFFRLQAMAWCAHPKLQHQWFAVGATKLHLRNLNTGEALESLPEGPYTAIAFHSDGQEIFVATWNSVIGYQLKPFQPTLRINLKEYSIISNLEFSPIDDGILIVYATSQPLRGYYLDGELAWEWADHQGITEHGLAVLPDGRQLAVTNGTSLLLLDTRSGQVLREYDWQAGPLTAVAVSADGTLGAVGSSTGEIVVFDLD